MASHAEEAIQSTHTASSRRYHKHDPTACAQRCVPDTPPPQALHILVHALDIVKRGSHRGGEPWPSRDVLVRDELVAVMPSIVGEHHSDTVEETG